MTLRLPAEKFTSFFSEVYGEDPFPWQEALVARVLDEGRWPDIIDVPTGLGKTALLDIAVFVAAARPSIARRRIYLVVDRRLIVDQAYRHARDLQARLHAGKGTCGEIAALLRADGDDPGKPVLDVTRMRGGTTWSWRWLDRPDRHAIITGTIDQIGSRLLFRGYGLGENLRPIDAALTGTDSLILIDEAHLAEPFIRTVTDAVALEPAAGWRPPVVVTMSATASPQPGQTVHTISLADQADQRAAERLNAHRGLRLLTAPKGGVERCLARWAAGLAGPDGSGNVVAVVCNTIGRARAVFDLLEDGPADTRLLIGRIRDIDRDYLMRTGWFERSKGGRTRGPGRPLILVSTQTIEVGADIDADVLITESAPLSALVQRLGRLNRRGHLRDAPALVVHDPAVTADDPVYGQARLATWMWLSGLTPPVRLTASADLPSLPEGLDASPLALRHLIATADEGTLASMRPPPPYVPVLTAATMDTWARTSPAPYPDTPVAPFLHGIEHGRPDVSVVWRSGHKGNDEQWKQMAATVPPSADEAIQVPLPAIRRWLSGEPRLAADLSDLDTTAPEQADEQNDASDPPERWRILRYQNPDTISFVHPAKLAPGDLLIVPDHAGGCDEYGWNPDSKKPVTDVADFALRHGRPMLRLTRQLPGIVAAYHPELADALADLAARALDDLEDDALDGREYRRVIASITGRIPRPDGPGEEEPRLVRNLRLLATSDHMLPYPPPAAEPGASTPAGILLDVRGGGLETDRTPLGSSAIGNPTKLTEHQQAVAYRAREFASNLDLSELVSVTVEMAAKWHDEGKRDPRFQAMLRGRSVRTIGPHLAALAKSGMDPSDHAAFSRAQQIAGYPDGMRHEALSAEIVALYAQAAGDDIDTDLLVHLVAAHHGRSRPLLPPVSDPDPSVVRVDLPDGPRRVSTSATVDWDAPARFARLNQQYGRWGLALLETVVRLADIWCSERDERRSES